MTELNVNNFVSVIKSMDSRERGKLRAADLINLIIQLPDQPSPEITDLTSKFDSLLSHFNVLESRCNNNTAEIFALKEINGVLVGKNENLVHQVNNHEDEILQLTRQVDGIEQYLRVNNVEIIGLNAPVEGASDEEVVIDAINNMNPTTPISTNDIDICHVLPTNRKDKKRTLVCKFISRKTKSMVLQTKKNNKDFKHRGNTFFINDHLSPANKRIFEIAKAKKYELNYKYQWTKNGYVYLRFDDRSPSIKITSVEVLNALQIPISIINNNLQNDVPDTQVNIQGNNNVTATHNQGENLDNLNVEGSHSVKTNGEGIHGDP